MSCILYNGQKYSNDEFANLLLNGELEKLSLEKKVDTPITEIGKEFSSAVKKIVAKFDRKMEMEKAKYEKALKSSPDLIKLRKFLKKDLSKNSKLSEQETIKQAGLTGIATPNELKNRLAIINNAWRTTKTRLENEKQLELNIAQEKPVKAKDVFSLTRILRNAFGLRNVFKTKDGKRISQDEAAATLMDKVLETIAKRQNVTKESIYNSTFYKRSRMEEINNSLETLLQAIGPKGITTLGNPSAKIYVNIDGNKRSEISDSNATFKFDAFSQSRIEDIINTLKKGTTLSNVLYHDSLYKAYPELANLKIQVKPLEKNEYRGYFTTNGKGIFSKDSEIVLNSNTPKGEVSFDLSDMMTTLLHEVQHAIQLIEGFEQGLDTVTYRKVVEKDIEATTKLISLMESANENQSSILASTKDIKELNDLEYSRADFNLNKVITESDIKKAEEHLIKASQLTYEDYMEMYQNTLEEVEARATEYRQSLTQEEIDEFSNRLEFEKNVSKHTKTSDPKIFKNFEDAIFSIIDRKPSILLQDTQAAYQSSGAYSKGNAKFDILQEGQDIIHAITNPNVSSPLHEVAHKFEKYLTQDERQVVLDFANSTEWTTETSETFARGFEKYLAEGNAPTPALQSIFEAFASWLMAIYNGITGSDIDIELNDKMREIYASMLGNEKLQSTIFEEQPTTTNKSDAEIHYEKINEIKSNKSRQMNMKTFVDIYFDNIVEQLINNKKLDKKC